MPASTSQSQITCARAAGTAVLSVDQRLARLADEFATRAKAHSATVERAYRHAGSTSGFAQGEHRRWRRPKNADAAWSSRVLQWARCTLAGPWFVPPAVVEQVCVLVALLVADSDVLVGVELWLIRRPDCALVVAAVCDAPDCAGRVRTRLVGEFIAGGPGDLFEPWDVVGSW